MKQSLKISYYSSEDGNTIVRIGIVAFQGAVEEHKLMLSRILSVSEHSITLVKRTRDLAGVDALILPGGESSTISHAMQQAGLFTALKQRILDEDIAIMGTCAGCVLLASELTDDSSQLPLLQAIDMQVSRNAFGRQCASFESLVSFDTHIDQFPAVFIRAPVITKVGTHVKILSTYQEKIVAARDQRFLAVSFHPELTQDDRIHSYFIDLI